VHDLAVRLTLRRSSARRRRTRCAARPTPCGWQQAGAQPKLVPRCGRSRNPDEGGRGAPDWREAGSPPLEIRRLRSEQQASKGRLPGRVSRWRPGIPGLADAHGISGTALHSANCSLVSQLDRIKIGDTSRVGMSGGDDSGGVPRAVCWRHRRATDRSLTFRRCCSLRRPADSRGGDRFAASWRAATALVRVFDRPHLGTTSACRPRLLPTARSGTSDAPCRRRRAARSTGKVEANGQVVGTLMPPNASLPRRAGSNAMPS